MARTRAASPHTGVRPRMVFRAHDRSGEFSNQDTRLTWADVAPKLSRLEQMAAELDACGAGWDSIRRTTDAGRLLTARRARRMLREVRLIEQNFYGTSMSWEDSLRIAGMVGLLSRVSDELMSWVEFWDAYSAENPAGFAHDCPEPETALPTAWKVAGNPPADLEPQPPKERARQLADAPGAPPAGITAS